MHELAWFALGTFSFWLLLIVESLLIFVFEATENTGWGVISVIATIAIMSYVGHVPIWSLISGHPVYTILILLSYIAAGILYSFWKWDRYGAKKRREFNEGKSEFLQSALKFINSKDRFFGSSRSDRYIDDDENHKRSNTLRGKDEDEKKAIIAALESGKIPDQWAQEWQIHLAKYKIPAATQNKEMIVRWMMFWPWSLIWTIVQDFVIDLFENIFRWLKNTYQKIANRHFADTDLKPHPIE